MFTWFCLLVKCPSQQRGITKRDIKPAPVADTTKTVSTGNLGDHNVLVMY